MHLIKLLLFVLFWSVVAGCESQPETTVETAAENPETARLDKSEKEAKSTPPLAVPPAVLAEPITPEQLVTFAFEGNLPKLVMAIEQGVDVNQVDEAGNWPLSFAAYQGHDRVVEFLLKQGADVAVRDSNGRTALMYAATLDQPKTLELLLDAGAEVNVVDSGEGWTPLMFAAGEGHVRILRLLIDRGAKLDVVDSDGDTALAFAVRNNHAEAAKLLRQ
jgi:ankyrin repeat protein